MGCNYIIIPELHLKIEVNRSVTENNFERICDSLQWVETSDNNEMNEKYESSANEDVKKITPKILCDIYSLADKAVSLSGTTADEMLFYWIKSRHLAYILTTEWDERLKKEWKDYKEVEMYFGD